MASEESGRGGEMERGERGRGGGEERVEIGERRGDAERGRERELLKRVCAPAPRSIAQFLQEAAAAQDLHRYEHFPVSPMSTMMLGCLRPSAWRVSAHRRFMDFSGHN